MKYSFEEKLRVVRSLLAGQGLYSLCRSEHLDGHLVRWWLTRYKAYGEDGLRTPSKGYHFSASKKEAIVLEHLQDGVTLPALCLRYDVSRSSILSWIRKVRSGGSLYEIKPRGRPPQSAMARPKKSEPHTELEKLQAENLRLRAELALLKKVRTLVEQKKAQARMSGRQPSTN